MTWIKVTGLACVVAAIAMLAPHASTVGHASPDGTSTPDDLVVRVTARPANGGLDCRVDFEFRNPNSYDVHIDWFNSYSKRNLGTWTRMANLSTGDHWLVRTHSTRRTTRLIRQGCTTRRAYRVKVLGPTVQTPVYSGRATKEFYIPWRESGLMTFTRENDLGPISLDWADCTPSEDPLMVACSR